MQPEELIARYAVDVAGNLPIRMRNDVALELRSLLREELQARSEAAARVPDAAMTLEMLQAFGHPTQVAARYHRPWAIIDPGDTRSFVLASLIGGALLAAASVPTALLHPERYHGMEGILLGWLGVLLLFFGIKSWARHRSPKPREWAPRPGDPHMPDRASCVAYVPLICLGIVAYGAPQWLFAQLTGGGKLTSWFDYDPAFRAERLPWLLALWAAQGVLLLVAAIRGDWTSLMRRLSLALDLAIMAVLTWFLLAGPIFEELVPNETAHAFLQAIVFALLINAVMTVYREVGRVREPELTAPHISA